MFMFIDCRVINIAIKNTNTLPRNKSNYCTISVLVLSLDQVWKNCVKLGTMLIETLLYVLSHFSESKISPCFYLHTTLFPPKQMSTENISVPCIFSIATNLRKA